MSAYYIPQGYNEKYSWLYNFENYFASNAPRFGLTQDTIMPLQELIIAFKIAKDKADAANAGSADRIERKEKADTVTEAARTFVNRYLRYNPDVTDYDRVQMGLTVPDTKPSPAPVPATVPGVEIKTPSPGVVELHYFDSTNTDSRRRAKPAGAHGAEILWAVLDTPPATDWTRLTNSAFDTATPYRFSFAGAERGRHLYFALRWENTRGEKGPLSTVFDAIIP